MARTLPAVVAAIIQKRIADPVKGAIARIVRFTAALPAWNKASLRAGATREPMWTDDAKRNGSESGRDDGARNRSDHADTRNRNQVRHDRHREYGGCPNHNCTGQQRALGADDVHQRAQRGLQQHAGKAAGGEDNADRRSIPVMLCQEVDAEVRSKAVTDVGQKEAQDVQAVFRAHLQNAV